MTPEEMDKAAQEAQKNFPIQGTAQDVVAWWLKNFQKSGHKRLGRILVQAGKSEKVAG